MKRYKKGVTVAKLKAATGYNDKKISNIVHRASKKGKIVRIDRGVYKLA
jgi:predicted transcriptional regulator of viral defense system